MKLLDTTKNIFNIIFVDTFGLLSLIIIGFLVILEWIIISVGWNFRLDTFPLKEIQNFQVTLPITIIIAICSFLIGTIIVESFDFVLSVPVYIVALMLIRMSNFKHIQKSTKITKFIKWCSDNLTTGRDPLFSFSVEYRQIFLKKVGDYLELSKNVGSELSLLSRELTSRHKKLFKMHLFQFNINIQKGLAVNFFLLFIYSYPKNHLIGVLFIFLFLEFYSNVRNEIRQLHKKIYMNAYLICLDEKKQKK